MKKRIAKKIQQRKEVEAAENKLNYRSFSLDIRADDGKPATLDEQNRSVEVIGATEEPVEVFDFERYEVVREVLLMDGVELPGNRQVPVLDSHSRFSTASVLGSYRGMTPENGQLTGRVHFSSAAEAGPVWTKVREGHLTDFSVGYRVIDSVWIPAGEKQTIRGRAFEGPLKVATRWRPKELSAVPIGADELAKTRSDKSQNEISTKKQKDENTMNKKLFAKLVKRGLDANATDAEAWAFFENMNFSLDEPKRSEPAATVEPVVPVEPTPVNADNVRTDERKRITEIGDLARAFNFPEDQAAKFIADGTDIEAARKSILDFAIAHKQQSISTGIRVEADERDKFRAAAEDSLMFRCAGEVLKAPEKAAPGADELRGMTLRELARESLRIAGERIPGNVLEMVGRALTTGDLPYVLGATANKSLLAGYDLAPETWRTWCGIGQASDFKTHTLHRVSESDGLEEVPEHGDYQYGERSEKKEAYALATYGKIFSITRQAIINDDLGALTDTPAKHGRAAARKVGDVAYAVLTANAAMGDGTALFATGHSNFVASSSGAAPGITTIAAGIKAMKLQKDLNGETVLNIRPRYFLGTAALEGAAEIFFNSFQYADIDTIATDSAMAATRKNPYAGTYFERVYDARLDAAVATGWYLAGPKGMTVNVYFLGGNEKPYVEQKQGWTVDGTEYKVRIDVAAKAVDWVALYYNYGA